MKFDELNIPRPGVEYYQDRSAGWDWNGTERWWVMLIVWDGGMNGIGALVCRQLWRWNGSAQTVRTEHVNLAPRELLKLANPGVDLDQIEDKPTPADLEAVHEEIENAAEDEERRLVEENARAAIRCGEYPG